MASITTHTPTHIPANVGRQTNQAVYLRCEHTHEEPPTREGQPTTVVHCTNVAIMMPGYHRACAAHLVAVLRRSILEYINREAAHSTPQPIAQLERTLFALSEAQRTLDL